MAVKDAELDRDTLIKGWAAKLQAKLVEVVPNRPVEADFRHAIEPLLDEFCAAVEVKPLSHAEYSVASGRIDAIFNRLIVEYKRPGVLKPVQDAATKAAIAQADGYVRDIARKERHQLSRLAAVVCDGQHLVFIRYSNDKPLQEGPLPINDASLARFLTWLSGLSSGVALTAENLNRDFAIEQPRTRNVLSGLYQGLNRALAGQENIVHKLFEQWRLFFGESIDYSEAFGGRKLEPLKQWARKSGLTINTSEEAERFFFALHTYFALLTKLLAWLALSRHLATKLGAPSFAELASLDIVSLRQKLRDMENGGIFRQYGIANLLEGDFFLWYTHVLDTGMEAAIHDLLARLDEYDPTTLSIKPEETRDLFKKLYHYLLPREVRHNLGEYYTPDWLAQRLLNQVDNEFFTANPTGPAGGALRRKLLTLRWLDPACGSGTFPVLVIARLRALGAALMVDQRQLLEAILRNVVGFDLNPLAVLTSRVNYVLQIADLLEYRKSEITIPVYPADSVRLPSEGSDIFGKGAYEFPTAVGKFAIPAALCTPSRFPNFCQLLEQNIEAGIADSAFLAHVGNRLGLGQGEWDEQARQRAGEAYRQLAELHRQGLNGLWARLLENNFAPLTVGQFDYVVGNPPWINWESLPDGYRDEIKPIWQRYGLFPHGGMDTILGKGKKEIATLMTYVMADRLLRDGGRLGFVITQTVFKTSGASQGFRRFRIPQGEGKDDPLRVVHVDDLTAINPFEGATNRTAVVVLEKGRPTTYPVPYTLWNKRSSGRLTYESVLADVIAVTQRTNLGAEPVEAGDFTAAWITGRPRALKALKKVQRPSEYVAHAGSYSGGANGVYWLEETYHRPDGLVVVRNLTEGAKVSVPATTEALEEGLLYPLLRGRDVKRWRCASSALILLAQDPDKREGIEGARIQAEYPRTAGYLERFTDILRARAAFKRYYTRKDNRGRVIETAPFYSMFNIGRYTLAPWKVVWREVASSLDAAVVGVVNAKPVIPDHTLIMVDCPTQQEAHYLCAALNSSPAKLAVESYIVLHPDPHILEHVGIPKFDLGNPLHQRLAELSAQAHAATQAGDTAGLAVLEVEVDRAAGQLWGLSDEELREIQRGLVELGGGASAAAPGEDAEG
ncbi:MAG: SAM-dependent DNA methyltransferase [Chloroflexi bacterium]|nr:SAM-dependent DNA methyltransferase [Chloroflexota bacterium]